MTQTWIAAAPRFTLLSAHSERCVHVKMRVRDDPGDPRLTEAACFAWARVRADVENAAVEWLPDLVEVLVRAGRCDEARSALATLEARAATTRDSSALAVAARCRGLLASEDSFEHEFLQALERHADTATPFERARTELCFGERLRRARRRADSREHLRSALDAFERLGADSWAARARLELAATGETLRSRELASHDELTPQERRIARLVARGATNKEVGAALFLSPKTIETHLGRVYRKLAIRSRTELAHLLARDAAAPAAA